MTAPAPVPGSAPTPFSIADDLPTGTVLLEASAGTGKTWTIGALVTRYVAEGVARLEQLLVVTFGRAASQELRERVRAQLVEAERVLSDDPVDVDAARGEESELVAVLRAYDEPTRRAAHRRVGVALADFDAATIATTHQFCAMVLESLGVAGDTDSRARLVEDLDEVVEEVVDDLYLRAFAHDPAGPAFSHDEARAIATTVVGDPQSHLEPAGEDRSTPAGRRVAFAHAVRAEVERRKRRLGVLSYDDLLAQLAGALADPDGPAASRMRQRWRIVLVDEFQDTDPVQWQVLDRAFTGHATMVLIGDPKQAIYAFRGGDVVTYLQAAETATTRHTLVTNRRTDAPLLAQVQRLLGGAALGDDRIVVHDVQAYHREPRLTGAPGGGPLRLRVVRRDDLSRGPAAMLTVGQVRPVIAEDLALDVRRLLASGAELDGRPLLPRDVAVIAHRHADLALAQEALARHGVPAVIAGAGSVFGTPAALEWLTLLEALEQPHRSPRVRAAALSCFVGRDAAELDRRGDDLTDEVAELLREWVELFTARGVAAVLEASVLAGLTARLLAREGGERLLTDVRQVGEALHEVTVREHHGVVSLLSWLREQVSETRPGRGGERTRRLDSDAAAVQLVTVHASKGLEYAVVYLPTLADRFVGKPVRPLFHDDEGRRCRNVGGSGEGWAEHGRRWAEEEAGESLRLLYVAATRAQSQVVCWWAPTKNAVASPLHRLLSREPGSRDVPAQPPVPPDDVVVGWLSGWRDRGGPQPEPARPPEAGADPPSPEPVDLDVRRFTRSVDLDWRRTSYSALTRVDAVAAGVASEPEVVAQDDEDGLDATGLDAAPEPTPQVGAADDVASPMAALPVGATFGSLVHAVLEHTDPDAPDLRAEIAGHVADQLGWWPVDLDPDVLVDALLAVHDTPLGPLIGTTLGRIPMADRLRELEFELPLAGGDRSGQPEARLADLAPLLERHLPPGDPVRSYAAALAGPVGEQSLRGYLTGSVDVVLRLPDADGGHRYVVVDYKTNWLGPRDVPLTAASYAPAALDAAMGHSDYPLQALLYAAVLHRFLRWREPGYDPARHLGGVAYLYLRGLCGPETPEVDGSPCGVFSWRPPVALVEELSELLAGRVDSGSAAGGGS